MEATAKLRYAKVTDRKANAVLKLIRGKKVEEALKVLAFTSRSAAPMIEKTLKSAIANANQKQNFDLEKARILSCTANQGPVQRNTKRWIARAMGRASGLKKESCHISVTVTDEAAVKKTNTRPKAAKKGSE